MTVLTAVLDYDPTSKIWQIKGALPQTKVEGSRPFIASITSNQGSGLHGQKARSREAAIMRIRQTIKLCHCSCCCCSGTIHSNSAASEEHTSRQKTHLHLWGQLSWERKRNQNNFDSWDFLLVFLSKTFWNTRVACKVCWYIRFIGIISKIYTSCSKSLFQNLPLNWRSHWGCLRHKLGARGTGAL